MTDQKRNEENKTTASVRVRVVVDVTVGSWGAASSFAELREQAIKEAKQKMQNVIIRAETRDLSVVSATAMHVHLKGELDER